MRRWYIDCGVGSSPKLHQMGPFAFGWWTRWLAGWLNRQHPGTWHEAVRR